MNTQQPIFDAEAFKRTTEAQWDAAAEAWDRWGGLLSRWLGPATERMFDLCGIGPGARVLDVAAGAGEQTLAAARRVGPAGHVLATDLSSSILARAAENARLAGLGNVETLAKDGEALDEIEAAPFDAVISRVGLIYFPDQMKALSGMRAKLREGGRIGAITYAEADANGFFSVPVSIIRRRADLPPPLPGQPGPFSLGDPDVLRDRLEAAGFRDVAIERVEAPVRLPSAADCLQFEQESFGALHQMMAKLSDAEKDAAWAEIEAALAEYETGAGFVGPCALLIAVGTK